MIGGERSPPPQKIGNATIFDNRLNGKFDDTAWIIDTGATHHVTEEKSWIFDKKNFECPIGLTNGEKVSSSIVGSICLSDKITLTGVLYVPNLHCNLLSVSQLIYYLHYIVQFNAYMYSIHYKTNYLI